MCLIKAPTSTTTALLFQDPLNKAMKVSELPGLLDKPMEALKVARFPFENLDALEVIYRDSGVGFRTD
jgi:hypothetical protein